MTSVLKKLSNVPNTITLFRCVLYTWAFILWQIPQYFISLYTVAAALDGLDGYFARKLNQCTRIGQMLDMIVDRSSHIILCNLLSTLLPKYYLFFSSISILDIASHWCLVYLHPDHHKKIGNNSPTLLRSYYTYFFVMDICIFLEECGFMLLYLHGMNVEFKSNILLNIFLCIAGMGWCTKTIINVQQLTYSLENV